VDSDTGTNPAPRRLITPRRALIALVVLFLGTGALAVFTRDGQGRSVAEEFVQDFSDQRGMRLVGERWPEIFQAAKKENLDPSLVAGVMWSESRGVSGRTSSAGALGLMQLVQSAAGDAARRLGVEAPEAGALLHDDAVNLALGCNHLAWIRDSTPEWSVEALLVAYNTGRGRLLNWCEEAGSFELWVSSQETRHADGRPLSPALVYARETLRVRALFRERFAGEEP